MGGQPTATITFLMSDVVGSTRLWDEHPEAMRAALVRHDRLIESLVDRHGGAVVRPRGEGDSRFAVFDRASDAVAAAVAIQQALHDEAWPTPTPLSVRMALHSGEAELREGDYYGTAVNRCARLRGAAHGGQTLLSAATYDLARDDMPSALGVEDLGERRLRDLTRPEKVFQLVVPGLPSRFPPINTLDARPHNLPVQATALIGRDREVEAVREQLAGSARLVTLTGPGGAGKSRLSLQVAAELVDRFDDGVFFVPLAPISDPALVAPAIARSMGVREQGGQPIQTVLHAHLRERRVLLVLDNFEQVVPAAPLLTALLAQAPALRLLVTSRILLRLYGEREFRVPPLALPDRGRTPPAEALLRYGAVRLFVERGQMVKPDFALTEANAPSVVEICHRLDGLPLAIELAAARVRILAPRVLLQRLSDQLAVLTGGPQDLPARQQTMRGAIAWSYDLLDEDEQALFRRLAVFVGGCGLSAVEALCGGGDVLDRLESLVDQSLLRVVETDEEARFTMFETLREYGLEQLTLNHEAEALQRRHAEHFLALAELAPARLNGTEQTEWLARLETEHDNLRAALSRLRHWGAEETGLRLAMALWHFWWLRGHFAEGRAQLEALLASVGPSTGTQTHATALTRVAELARVQGDYASARAHITQALAIWRGIGDEEGTAVALRELGRMAYEEGDCAAARPYLEESLAMQRALRNQPGTALSLAFLGLLQIVEGDDGAARCSLEESLGIARDRGDRTGIAVALLGLGRAAFVRGDRAEARVLLRRSLMPFAEIGPRSGIAYVLDALAELDVAEERPERALRLAGAAAALRETIHVRAIPLLAESYERWLSAARQAVGEPASTAAWIAGHTSPLEQAIAEALTGD